MSRAPWLVVLCAVAALIAPMWTLLLAPIAFGVPHVGADLRFLVARPPRPVPARLLWAVGAVFAVLTAVRVTAMLGGPAAPRVELGLGLGTVALGLAWSQRWRWMLPLGVLAVVMLRWPGQAALAVGHAHNLVAVGFWWWWSRGPARTWTVGLVAGVLAVVATGVLDGWWVSAAQGGAAGLTLTAMVDGLAPDLPGPWGLRLVMAFAFLQAVHYAMWLGAIPAARGRGSGWAADLGAPVMALLVAGTVALIAWGGWAPTVARSSYLSLVLFHGWLELAIGAFLLGARD